MTVASTPPSVAKTVPPSSGSLKRGHLGSIGELTRAYKARSLSPREVMETVLDAISRREQELNAFVLLASASVLREAAHAAEARWASGEPAGPLDGVPVTVKDTIRAIGWPTRMGSRTTSERADDYDAPGVARLREAGAIILGKTTTSEFGWKTVTDCPLTGTTRNPWNTALTPGGSSGGAAAAVAAGMAAASLGTDAAGSVRIPAAFCGLVGLKASRGRIPAFPPSAIWTLGHVGPITCCVRDAALLLDVLKRPDARDWNALPATGQDDVDAEGERHDLEGVRAAYSPTLGHAHVDPEVAACVEQAVALAAELGAEIELVDAPLSDAREMYRRYMATGYSHAHRNIPDKMRAVLDPGLAGFIEEGAQITREQFLEAYDFQIRITREARLFHQRFDVLLTPATAVPPFATDRLAPDGYSDWQEWSAFTYPFNLTGQPALTMCCGVTPAGLPVGLQIVGAMHAEREVLSIAGVLERYGGFQGPLALASEIITASRAGQDA